MFLRLEIFLLFFILHLNACQPFEMNPDTAKQTIEELYGKAIEIDDFGLNKSRGIYECKAHFNDEPDIVFLTELDRESGEVIRSNYPQLYWKKGYKEKLDPECESRFQKFVSDFSLFSDLESSVNHKNIPSFSDITDLESGNDSEMRIYFFEERNSDLWEKVRELIQLHKDLNFEKATFQFNFYDTDFFNDKNLDEFNYGFKVNGNDFFEMEYFEYLEGRILFTLEYDDAIPSVEELEEALDTNPNKFIIKPHKF